MLVPNRQAVRSGKPIVVIREGTIQHLEEHILDVVDSSSPLAGVRPVGDLPDFTHLLLARLRAGDELRALLRRRGSASSSARGSTALCSSSRTGPADPHVRSGTFRARTGLSLHAIRHGRLARRLPVQQNSDT
ncbi:hypothetical protein [Streptomyces roseoverticillatus]|uniref:Uncharacterized protein n=1 Tax=Streptomyces roseoverticillatus TaxID=66429 RepID=A0ABV3IQZ2_9ACTN